MASMVLNSSQKDFRNRFGLCNVYFAISRLKDGSIYCPGNFNLKAPILSPKQFAVSKNR